MKRIRAVTFDAGGTLIEPWPSVGAVYTEVAEEFGVACSPQKINEDFARSWKKRTNFSYTRGEWLEIVRASFGPECQVSDRMFQAIYDRFAESRCWLIFDDVIPTLQHLEDLGVKLAVISNWDERLLPLLQRVGLASYFNCISVSSTVGATKPSPEIFEHAARALALPSDQILHVGDSFNEDVQGAIAAGFQAVRIRRSGRTEPYDVGRLSEIPKLFGTFWKPQTSAA